MTIEKEDIPELWAQALESGEYKQGRRSLTNHRGTDHESFCCLGVLTKLYLETGELSTEEQNEIEIILTTSAILPPAVQDWARMKTRHGRLHKLENGNDNTRSLTAMNDHGYTFYEIAQEIRKNKNILFRQPGEEESYD